MFTDILGSVRAVTDESGNVDECYDYLPFGRMLTANDNGRSSVGCYPSSPSGFTSDLPEKFTGQQRDEIQLDYFIARYFSGGQGRFTGADLPFIDQRESDPQSWNLYAYVRNNPFSFIDPTGREIACVIVTSDSADAFGRCEGRFDEFLLSSFLSDLPCGIDVVIDGVYAYTCGDYTPAFVEESALETTPLDIGFLDLVLPGSFGKAVGFFGFADDLGKAAVRASRDPGDWARLSGILRTASRGKGNFGIGTASRQEARAMGRAWVGPGYRVASDGKTLRSADGLRQYRPPSFKPGLGRTQANFQSRPPGLIQWQSNGHLNIID